VIRQAVGLRRCERGNKPNIRSGRHKNGGRRGETLALHQVYWIEELPKPHDLAGPRKGGGGRKEDPLSSIWGGNVYSSSFVYTVLYVFLTLRHEGKEQKKERREKKGKDGYEYSD